MYDGPRISEIWDDGPVRWWEIAGGIVTFGGAILFMVGILIGWW